MFPAQTPYVKAIPQPSLRRRHTIVPDADARVISMLCDADVAASVRAAYDGRTWRELYEVGMGMAECG